MRGGDIMLLWERIPAKACKSMHVARCTLPMLSPLVRVAMMPSRELSNLDVYLVFRVYIPGFGHRKSSFSHSHPHFQCARLGIHKYKFPHGFVVIIQVLPEAHSINPAD